MSDVSDDKLREIIAGTEGVTPGPWVHGYWGGRCRKEHAHRGRNGSDPCVYDYSIVEGANGVAAATERVEVLGSDDDGLAAKEIDLRYIARLDPATVRSICEELLALRAALERLSVRTDLYAALEEQLAERGKPFIAAAEEAYWLLAWTWQSRLTGPGKPFDMSIFAPEARNMMTKAEQDLFDALSEIEP